MSSSNGWFMRGGYYITGSNAGAFSFNNNGGSAGGADGARAVLLLSDYNIIPKGSFSIYKFKDLYHK